MDEDKKDKIIALFKEGSEPCREPDTPSQSIVGDGNIQAGGNVTIRNGPEFDPRNSNLMPCPACGRPVSRTADQCPDCADNFAHRRRVALEEAQNERAYKIMGGLLVFGACSYGVGQLFQSVRTPAWGLAALAVFYLYLLVNRS